MDERTPTPVQGFPISGLPGLPGQHHPTGESPIAFSRIQLPLVMALAAAFAVATALASLLITWVRISDHTTDKNVHLQTEVVVEGGGVAYKKDVRISEIRIRNAVRTMKGNCAPIKGDGWACTFNVPEPIE